MSTPLDTTPTAEDLTAARARVAELVRSHGGGAHAELAMRVAVVLGVVVAHLEASNAADARFTAQARALHDEWMRL